MKNEMKEPKLSNKKYIFVREFIKTTFFLKKCQILP